MAIFSRRDLQAALNSLAGVLTQDQLEGLVSRLNGEVSESLSAEWEVSVLAAFSQCGRIQYEKDFGGRRRPDLFFQFGQTGKFEFLADITTISDTAARTENEYGDFYEAIRWFLKKRGHISASIYLDVQGEQIGEYGNRKVRLLLPEKGQMKQFVKMELGQFLTKIANEPDKDASFAYNQNRIRFSIRYDSSEKKFGGGRHIDYTVPYSRRRNPLANALDNKGNQLSNSGYQGLMGVVVCDGGCNALNERSRVNGAYGCQEIIEGIFQTRSSISFVLVLRIEQQHRSFVRDSLIQIVPKIYWNPTREKTLLEETLTTIERMLKWLPSPESTPNNAIRWLTYNKNVGRPLGGFTMKGDTYIRISARALTELLAGKIELKRFLEEHGFKPSEINKHPLPFFEWQLQHGHTLKNTFVEREEHKDDDWIVLEYNGPDPAISPYRVPSSPTISFE